MEKTDITIWVVVVIAFIFGFIVYSLKPSRCPNCKTRMKSGSKEKDGKEVSFEYCPKCGFELIVDER